MSIAAPRSGSTGRWLLADWQPVEYARAPTDFPHMLKADFFKGKRVTVFGIGLNGGALGAIEFLIQSGVREVIATDIRSREELLPSLEKLKNYKNISYVLGQHRPEDFTHTDYIVKSPGIPWTNEYIKLALEKKIPVETDASIFFQLVKQKTIAVTGTRGKSTTAALIAHILESAGLPVVRVGINQIGFLSELPKITDKSLIVAELSSWRLSSLRRVEWSPSVAVVTNFSPDHQNYYKSMEAYAKDKLTLLEFQKPSDVAVLNFDHAVVRGWQAKTAAHVVSFSVAGALSQNGVFLAGGQVHEYRDGDEELLFPLELPGLVGKHNEANALAAVAAARSLGVTPDVIARALKSFRGLPHRLEVVGERDGMICINDTAATSPAALRAALEALTRPVILIAGGADKNFDFTELAPILLAKAKAIILLKGTGTEKLLPLLEKVARERGQEQLFPVMASMEDAVAVAFENAQSGDAILLSPGMASFGLFRNEFDRGEQFRAAVRARLETLPA